MVETLIILGPTAVGKTEVSVFLAERIAGEIISADAMQVYRGMDIATAKPSPPQQLRVPHHLIDILDLGESYSAARFRTLALNLIREIRQRGRIPFVVGGSGLYLRVLVDGLSPAPPADWALRRFFEEEEKKRGRGYLYRRLREVDPDSAGRVHENDLKRIIRALEVMELSGIPISQWRKEWPDSGGPVSAPQTIVGGPSRPDEDRGKTPHPHSKKEGEKFLIVGLRRSRADLYDRINKRVEEMFDRGLIEETKRLLEKGANHNQVAWQALGYKEVEGLLRGEYSLEEARERLSRNTRHFAKRQLTWWRKDERIRWVDIESSHRVEDTIEAIINILKREEGNK